MLDVIIFLEFNMWTIQRITEKKSFTLVAAFQIKLQGPVVQN